MPHGEGDQGEQSKGQDRYSHHDRYAEGVIEGQEEYQDGAGEGVRLSVLSLWQVLDVSTGAGHTALIFAPRVAHVIASDLTPEMLDTARNLLVKELSIARSHSEEKIMDELRHIFTH